MGTRRLGDRTGHRARTAGNRRLGPNHRTGRRHRGRGRADGRSRGRCGGPARWLRPHGRWVDPGGTRRARGSRRGGRGRCRSSTTRGVEGTTKSPGHGGLDRAGCGFDELAHLFELGENGLAVDPELFGELVNAGLAWHCTPHLEVVRAAPADLTRALEAWSFQGLHRVLIWVVLPCWTWTGRRPLHHRLFRAARRSRGCARQAIRCQQHR